jgi:hypothetical protein
VEVAPDVVHPVYDKSALELLDEAKKENSLERIFPIQKEAKVKGVV